MITFPCRCGHKFEVTQDQAGSHVQCPDCGLLNDVPYLNALSGIADDGTYRVEDAPRPTAKARRVNEAARKFGGRTYDDQGKEIDLRTDPMELELAPEAPAPRKNRYDPETGELIRPIEVAPRQQKVLPALRVAQQELNYLASHGDVVKRLTPAKIFLDLLMPANLVVWGMVLAAQIAWSVLMFFAAGIIITLNRVHGTEIPIEPLMLPLAIFLLAHYCNVTEDTGPDLHDDLVRPLRDLRFHEDFFVPFMRASVALVLSYAPAALMLMLLPYLDLPLWLSAIAFASTVLAGSLVAPALMLTMAADGTLDNIKPTRLAAVITASGPLYSLVMLVWTIGLSLCFITIFGTRWWPDTLRQNRMADVLGDPRVYYGLMAIGTYLLHAACWNMGLIYRMHHDRFNWLHRQHVRTQRPVRRAPSTRPMGRNNLVAPNHPASPTTQRR